MAENQRFPWVAVSALAGVGIVAAIAWLEVPDGSHLPKPISTQPSLRLTRVDDGSSPMVLAEKLAAYDPTPLFLPSPMNVELPRPSATPDDVAGPFKPLDPSFSKTGPVHFQAQVIAPGAPIGGLRLTERSNSPLMLARRDSVGDGLPNRLCQLEGVEVATGRVVFSRDLPLSDSRLPGDWQPLELMGAVSRFGLVGKLVVTRSSGSDEVDDYFLGYLADRVRIDARLPRGIYAFRVGP